MGESGVVYFRRIHANSTIYILVFFIEKISNNSVELT